MTEINNRIQAFVKLGAFMSFFSQAENKKKDSEIDQDFIIGFNHQIQLAKNSNGWFTPDNIAFSLHQWAKVLTENNLKKWLSAYTVDHVKSKTIAVIMAGNIPLVGFHDFLCVLMCGHSVLVKLSSNDQHLLPYLAKYLEHIEPSLREKIVFTKEKLEDFDAIIATGSDNTSRYFEFYFGKKPNIIRRSRNSIAILTGNESNEQLEALGEDIFRYYGLGCRNVSKLFVPENYDFDSFFKAIYKFNPIINGNKYANNYDYNKAVYLMSLFNVLENGFLMLKEDESYASPIASLFYEYYTDLNSLQQKLKEDEEKIQCIVAHNLVEKEVDFGETQKPKLWNYADQIDTMNFLLDF